MTSRILFENHNSTGLVTLNRPEALNAMDAGMALAMREQLQFWADDPEVTRVVVRGVGKAFCVGGDIRAVWALRTRAMEFFAPEYALVRTVAAYPKPYIALMDGITMGGGVGISLHGSARIATPATVWAMPECAIGFYPDVGATWFLPRLPGRIGTYLALTGARLRAADLLWLGLATGYAASAEAWLAGLPLPAPDAGEPTLPALQPAIDRCFGHETVPDILRALQDEPGAWAAGAAEQLLHASPFSLAVTLRQMQAGGRVASVHDALILEHRLTSFFTGRAEFFEGIRAALIDRDNAPAWETIAANNMNGRLIEKLFTDLK